MKETKEGQEEMARQQVPGKRRREPKKRWLDNIRDDMKEYKMTKDMMQNRSVAHEDKGRPITTWRKPIGERSEHMIDVDG